MKILQINSHYDKGGAARIVACIHRELLRQGHDAYVAYGRGEGEKEKNVYQFNHRWEVYLAALVSRITGLNGWWNRGATRRLIKYIESIQPDVIHLHVLHGYYLNFKKLFSYINSHEIPCVWTFHDCHAFVGNCGYFFECQRWKDGCGSCPYLHGYPASQFFDFTGYMWKHKKALFTLGKRKVVVSPSDWLTGMAKKSFIGKYPCMTIRNGIDVEKQFYPRDRRKCRAKYGFSQEDKLVLGIAVDYRDPRKGVKYIIQMAKDLENEIKVVLIGWNEEDSALLAESRNITAISFMDDTDMLAEYYSMADLFVLPSLAENYATVSLEAMACGTPVVGFDAGGIPEQLMEGKGTVVETGNQEKFREEVRRALSEECGLLRGEELARIIRQENSVEKMTGEYLKVYEGLLNVP